MRLNLAPTFDAMYYSFYIEGLRRLGHSWRLTTVGMPPGGHHGLAIVGPNRRTFVSASDGPGIPDAALAWADVVGKVNANDPPADGKVVPIGPSFPVTAWRPAAAWFEALRTWLRGAWRSVSARRHFGAYRAQYRYRLPESAYLPGTSDPNYLFAMSRLWRKEPETNQWRFDFLEAAASRAHLQVDGGFVAREEAELRGFASRFVERPVELAEWIARTQRSAAVFNTPAVSGCHGWKLGEFLALGKAIITTPPVRRLPAPLVHGETAHIITSPTDLGPALDQIRHDQQYRDHLERSARSYYEKWLSPRVVMERLLGAQEPQ